MAFFSLTLFVLTHCQQIQFKPLETAKHVFESQQENTNANILEKAYCKINTFNDPLTNDYYHWYTQTMSNYTVLNVLNDYLNEYSNKNNNLINELPHFTYYSYSEFDFCTSKITNNTLTCFIIPSCCFGCASIGCELFINNESNPVFIGLNYMISEIESGSFAQKPQISCMSDGYLVSYIWAKREKPSNNSFNYNDEMIFNNYTIKYVTIDFDGNLILSNKTLYKFDTFDLNTAINNYQVISLSSDNDAFNNKLYGSYSQKINNSNMEIKTIISDYNGLQKELTIKSNDIILWGNNTNSEFVSYFNETETDKSIIINMDNNCCILTVSQIPFVQNTTFSIKWLLNINYFNGTNKYKTIQGNDVGFVDIIELIMFNNDNSNKKYFIVVYDDLPHSINIMPFYMDNNMNIVKLDAFQLIGDDVNSKTNDYIYSFCMNILPNSTNLIMSWSSNPNEVLQMVNGYIQSWKVTLSTN